MSEYLSDTPMIYSSKEFRGSGVIVIGRLLNLKRGSRDFNTFIEVPLNKVSFFAVELQQSGQNRIDITFNGGATLSINISDVGFPDEFLDMLREAYDTKTK